MRSSKNRLQELAQTLQQRQAQSPSAGQGQQQSQPTPKGEAKSSDGNPLTTSQRIGQGQPGQPHPKVTVEAMAFDHNEPIELHYNQQTGGYEHNPPIYAAAQSVEPVLDFGSEAFEVESFDAEPVTVANAPVSVQPEVVVDQNQPMPIKSATPSAQSFSAEAPPEPKSTAPQDVATADDFLEDLNAILNGEKTYDGNSKQIVSASPQATQLSTSESFTPASTSPRDSAKHTSPHDVFDRMAQGLPPEPVPTASPTPTYSDAHSVFDRMGKNMAFANSFDLGTISLQQRFDEFDAILDEQESAAFAYKNIDISSVGDRREQSTPLTYKGEESYQLGLVDDFKAFLASMRSPLRYENLADKDPKVKEKTSVIDRIREYFSNYEILKDDEAIKEADQVYREEIIADIGKFKDFDEDKKRQILKNIVEDFSDDIGILSKLGELCAANLLSLENIEFLLSEGIDVPTNINKILDSFKEGKTINDLDLEFLIYKIQTAPIEDPFDTSSSTKDPFAQHDREEILKALSANLEKLTSDQQAKLIEEGILIAYVVDPSISDSVKDVAVKGHRIYKVYKKVEDAKDKLDKLKSSGFVSMIFKPEKDGKEVEDNSTFLRETIGNISSRLGTIVDYISKLANDAEAFVEDKFEGLIEFFEKIATSFGEKFAAVLPGWNAVMLLNSARKLWSRTKILKNYTLSDELPKDLQEAFTYSYQKILRAFQTALFRAILHIVKTISRLVTVLSLGSAAIVTESLEQASDIILKIESAGRKLKGAYKLLKGIRGVGRLKNAGVIVHYAIGEGKTDKATNQVAIDMVRKFVDKLPINLEEEAGFAKEESIKQLIAALSEQLKSQPA